MKNDTGIEPIRDKVLIRIIPEGKTDGGIVLPDGVRLKNRAQVVAVGGGHLMMSGATAPLAVQPGDFVICHLPKGTPVVERDPQQGDLVLVEEQQIIAIDRRMAVAPVVAVPTSETLQ